MRSRQTGLTMWGWLMVLGLIAFFATVGIKTVPIYLNHGQAVKAIKSVASDPSNANASVAELRRSLQRRWDIDYISRLEPKDIKVKRLPSGQRALVYEYEAREHLFYNISIVVEFAGEEVIQGSGNS